MGVKLIIPVLCGLLFALGGYNRLIFRRWLMPIILTGSAYLLTHNLWVLTMLSAGGALSLGYGDKSQFRHIFGDSWGRGVWGLIVALCLSLALFIIGHLAWYWLAVYLTACFFAEPLFKNLWQVSGDFIIGAVFGSVILMIH